MKMYLRLLPTFMLVISLHSFGQNAPGKPNTVSEKDCYMENITSDNRIDPLVTKIDRAAYYKGTPNNQSPIFHKIDVDAIMASVKPAPDSYRDTAVATFGISSQAKMSNIQIDGTSNEVFKNLLLKSIRESACGWRPAEHNGQSIDTWVRLKFTLGVHTTPEEKRTVSAIGWSYVEK